MSNVDCAGIILSAGWICLWQVWGGDNGVADSEESAVQGHHRPELKNVFWQMWVRFACQNSSWLTCVTMLQCGLNDTGYAIPGDMFIMYIGMNVKTQLWVPANFYKYTTLALRAPGKAS